MRTFGIVTVFSFLIGWFAIIYGLHGENGKNSSTDYGVAINFVTYREAVMRHIFHHKELTDRVLSLPDVREFLPDSWQMLNRHPWSVRISGGEVYIWGDATPAQIFMVRELLKNSLAVGENQNGILQPSGKSLPNFIANGSLVSVTGDNR